MKKTLIIGILFFVLAGLASLAYADLNIFLNDLITIRPLLTDIATILG